MELILNESLQKAQFNEPNDSWDVLQQTPPSAGVSRCRWLMDERESSQA